VRLRRLILDQEIGTSQRLGITLDRDPANQEGQFGDMNGRRADPRAQRIALSGEQNRGIVGDDRVRRRFTRPVRGTVMHEGQQVSRNFVLDPPQSHAEPQNQIVRQRGIAAHPLQELPRGQNLNFAVRNGGCRRAAAAALDDAHLAQPLAVSYMTEQDRGAVIAKPKPPPQKSKVKRHQGGSGGGRQPVIRRNGRSIWRGVSRPTARRCDLRAASPARAAGVSRRDLTEWALCDSEPQRRWPHSFAPQLPDQKTESRGETPMKQVHVVLSSTLRLYFFNGG
jgi:hypothetical protein